MIKNIIFDLGNVIIDVDDRHYHAALQKLGVNAAHDIYTLQKQNTLCEQFERGEIKPAQFLKALGGYTQHIDATEEALQQAWEAMIEDSAQHRLNTLVALRDQYQIYLLSNTNQIHYDFINRLFSERYAIASLDDLFDKAYYSFRLGIRKPDVKIFKHVLKENKLDPQQTLFVDDLDKNIQSAATLGLQTHHAVQLDDTWKILNKLIKE